MGLITLEGMEFFAYHGLFDEEQKIGNKFSIDVSIKTDLKKAAISDNLKDTINYTEVYEIVKDVMNHKHRLLEHVGQEIIKNTKASFSNIKNIKVTVAKFNPPIGGICKTAKVIIED